VLAQAVELGPPARLRPAPGRLQEAAALEPVQRGVERALVDVENAFGPVAEGFSDRVAVQRTPTDRAQDEDVQRTGEEIASAHARPSPRRVAIVPGGGPLEPPAPHPPLVRTSMARCLARQGVRPARAPVEKHEGPWGGSPHGPRGLLRYRVVRSRPPERSGSRRAPTRECRSSTSAGCP